MFVVHLFVVVAPKCPPLLTFEYFLNLNLQASFENEEEWRHLIYVCATDTPVSSRGQEEAGVGAGRE